MEKKKSSQEILENYALGKTSLKWVPEGAEILKSIGSEVVFVRFTRENAESNWITNTSRVFIISIRDFDPMTGTYQIVYRKIDDESKEAIEERIIPEGFSFNNPEKDNWMNRFIPMSLHFKLTEEEIYYHRLKNLYNSRSGLPIQKIQELKNTKQEESLGYHNYIAAVIDSDVSGGLGLGIISFRIYEITTIQMLSKAWSFGIKDKDGNYFPIKFENNQNSDGVVKNFSVNGVIIGDLKIMDIEDEKVDVDTTSETEIENPDKKA